MFNPRWRHRARSISFFLNFQTTPDQSTLTVSKVSGKEEVSIDAPLTKADCLALAEQFAEHAKRLP